MTRTAATAPGGNSTTGLRRKSLLVLRVALVAAAAWALRRELMAVSADGLVQQIGAIGWPHIGLALALAAVSFVLLGVVEILGLRYGAREQRAVVPAQAAFGTSFVASAFSQSVGLSVLTGTAVRVRSYTRFGLSGASVGQVSGFVTLTSTLGLLAVGAWALATTTVSPANHLGAALRPVAVVLGLLVLAYLAWSVFGRRPAVGRGNWIIMRPTPWLAASQIALSALDWLVTGAVLFALLPGAPLASLGTLPRSYMVAQVAGVSSHVPAGAGVFELVMIALLAGGAVGAVGDADARRAALVASLVMFRVVYYLVPLCVAIVVAGTAEVMAPEVANAG